MIYKNKYVALQEEKEGVEAGKEEMEDVQNEKQDPNPRTPAVKNKEKKVVDESSPITGSSNNRNNKRANQTS